MKLIPVVEDKPRTALQFFDKKKASKNDKSRRIQFRKAFR